MFHESRLITKRLHILLAVVAMLLPLAMVTGVAAKTPKERQTADIVWKAVSKQESRKRRDS